MKILVLSLLRLGDLIQQRVLLNSLREKHPGAEIHLLVNRQFQSVESLFVGEGIRFHYFDRRLLQKTIGEPAFNLFTPLDLLEDLIRSLDAEHFDLALNWTHNRLSAFLLGSLNIPEKKGLVIQGGQVRGLENPWLRYFNNFFSGVGHSFFHYNEILGKAFNLSPRPWPLRKDPAGPIYFQCFTSEAKKNWPLENYRELFDMLNKEYPNDEVRVLAAPAELETLSTLFPSASLYPCGLGEARELLREARLLITPDTSIKHLAAECGTPVLEIALGSADPVKTAAFADEVHVICEEISCFPCPHGGECSQASRLCAEALPASRVYERARPILAGTDPVTRAPAKIRLERAVWTSYLDGIDLQMTDDFIFSTELMESTDRLWQHQLDFESCEKFNEIFKTLQQIKADGLDQGFYFHRLALVFGDRFDSAENAIRALKEGLAQSRELLEIRSRLIHHSLSTKGEKNAERT